MPKVRTNIEIEDIHVRAIMDRFSLPADRSPQGTS